MTPWFRMLTAPAEGLTSVLSPQVKHGIQYPLLASTGTHLCVHIVCACMYLCVHVQTQSKSQSF